MSRRKVERETSDYLGMVRRVIRSAGRRVAEGDEVDLAELLKLRESVEEAIADAVRGQREQYGRSWAYIALGLGTTRQNAQQRYGRAAS